MLGTLLEVDALTSTSGGARLPRPLPRESLSLKVLRAVVTEDLTLPEFSIIELNFSCVIPNSDKVYA